MTSRQVPESNSKSLVRRASLSLDGLHTRQRPKARLRPQAFVVNRWAIVLVARNRETGVALQPPCSSTVVPIWTTIDRESSGEVAKESRSLHTAKSGRPTQLESPLAAIQSRRCWWRTLHLPALRSIGRSEVPMQKSIDVASNRSFPHDSNESSPWICDRLYRTAAFRHV